MSRQEQYMTDALRNVGNNIKRYRKENNMTIEQLAKLISKSKSTVSKYENGSTIDLPTIIKIAEVLNVEVNQIVNGISTVKDKSLKKAENISSGFFNGDKLYLYYFDGCVKRMKCSIIEKLPFEAAADKIPIKVYFNIKDPVKFWRCEYKYTGFVLQTSGIAFILMYNDNQVDVSLSVIPVPQRKAVALNGLMMGLSDNPRAPVCIKFLISKKYIADYEKLKDACKINKAEIRNTRQFNRLYVQYEYIDELFAETKD
ncbi:MAG: helix-turn-helix transcriptional regulator [Clostridiaceae bacterium]|nr:helix-turn-helix transcriptional regulator [Clostridiaceae bacterium]